jgi:ribosomal protein L3 glutamine methyltransferase
VSPVEELRSVADWLRYTATRFAASDLYYGHGTDNAWDEALALVRGYLRLPPDKMEFVLDARLTGAEREALAALIERRIEARVPVPYLTGEAYFAGRRYVVEPGVLIPRSPIGELIEAGFAPWIAQAPETILDLCSGCGCIGIACALEFPDAVVCLADSDPLANEVARRNVALHGLEARVHVIDSDLFAAFADQRFDLIVTNPPYVAAAEIAAMPSEFKHEPRHALAAGGDGLDVVRRILAEARGHLADNGVLVGEVGASAEQLVRAFATLDFVWPEFERGGDGVFVIEAARLPG